MNTRQTSTYNPCLHVSESDIILSESEDYSWYTTAESNGNRRLMTESRHWVRSDFWFQHESSDIASTCKEKIEAAASSNAAAAAASDSDDWS